MPRQPLAPDTSPEVEALQIERWRQMTPAEKGEIITGLTKTHHRMDCFDLNR